MKIEIIKKEELKYFEGNPRYISEQDLENLKKSLTKFGFVEPLVIDENNIVIGGNQRLLAVKDLNITEIPCFRVIGLTPTEKNTLNLALNRISGDWNEEKLSIILKQIKEEDNELLNLTGFNEQEITDFSLFENDDFKRPEFDEIIDKFNIDKNKTQKNENWFYIEYYDEPEKFKELTSLLKLKGKSMHEIDNKWFYDLIIKCLKKMN